MSLLRRCVFSSAGITDALRTGGHAFNPSLMSRQAGELAGQLASELRRADQWIYEQIIRKGDVRTKKKLQKQCFLKKAKQIRKKRIIDIWYAGCRGRRSPLPYSAPNSIYTYLFFFRI